mgnify:CR=1 FL=1
MNGMALNLFSSSEDLVEQAHYAISDLSRRASKALSASTKTKYAQYFTEGVIAQAMSKRLTLSGDTLRIGDHGAGSGVLGATTLVQLMSRHGRGALNLGAYEIDESLYAAFFDSMAIVEQFACDSVSRLPTYTLSGDFTTTDLEVIKKRQNTLNGAVINPPYQKLNQSTDVAQFMKKHFVSVPNMYALFVVLTIDMLKDGGEMVAILPRSFMSGAYFKLFRRWLRQQGSIDWFHRYKSRSNAFRGDNVLQENILLKFVKGKPQAEQVEVSVSSGPEDKNCSCMTVKAIEIFSGNECGHMTLPCSLEELNSLTENSALPLDFDDLGLTVTTGKLEDFRYRDALRYSASDRSLPVVYAQHWTSGEQQLAWSENIVKPCYAKATDDITKRTLERGNYVLVKRISANGDSNRCHSIALLEDANLPGDEWLIDNHVQVISSKNGLSKEQALRIQRHLSSHVVENVLRTKSGTTQLNKDDLRAIRFPADCANH